MEKRKLVIVDDRPETFQMLENQCVKTEDILIPENLQDLTEILNLLSKDIPCMVLVNYSTLPDCDKFLLNSLIQCNPSDRPLMVLASTENITALCDCISKAAEDSSASSSEPDDIRKEIEQTLVDAGFSRLLGTFYLSHIILLGIKEKLPLVLRPVYAIVADEYSTSQQNVDRAIRNTVDKAWKELDMSKNLYSLFNKELKSGRTRPTNKDLIHYLIDCFSEKYRL